MKKGGGSESTIIIGPSKSVLVYALHSLENILGLVRFRVFVPKLLLYKLTTETYTINKCITIDNRTLTFSFPAIKLVSVNYPHLPKPSETTLS